MTTDPRKRVFAAAAVLSLGLAVVLSAHGRNSENSRQTRPRPSTSAAAIAATASTHVNVRNETRCRPPRRLRRRHAPAERSVRRTARPPSLRARPAERGCGPFVSGWLPPLQLRARELEEDSRGDGEAGPGARGDSAACAGDRRPCTPAGDLGTYAGDDRQPRGPVVARVDDRQRRYAVALAVPTARPLGRDRDQRLIRVAVAQPRVALRLVAAATAALASLGPRSAARGHPDGRPGTRGLRAGCKLRALGGRPRRHPRQLPRLDPRRSAALRPRLERDRRDLLDRERLRPARRPRRPRRRELRRRRRPRPVPRRDVGAVRRRR